jgi:protein TonB
MKLFSFLFVSMALHAAALAYPVLFLESRAASPVVVTVVGAGEDGDSGSAGEATIPEKKTKLGARKAVPAMRQARAAAEPQQVSELPQAISEPVIAPQVTSSIAVSTSQTQYHSFLEGPSLSTVGPAGAGASGVGNGGSGPGIAGMGTGSSGKGHGAGNGGSPSIDVTYDFCPKPDYPESARREGQQGMVTVRVLVNEEGRPRSLELSRSSGFAALDQAAMETVRRCRFHPAYDGEKRVARWVPVPIEFSLKKK